MERDKRFIKPARDYNLFCMNDFCHPEHSEGSRRCKYHKNTSVDYDPSAFRFFASLRFAQNDILSHVLVQ